MGSVTTKELSAMPNAGQAQFVQGRFVYPSNPEYYAKYGKKFLDAGVKVLGGCCGTTPEHILALSQILEGLSPRKRKIISVELTEKKEILKKENITSDLKLMLEKRGVLALEVDPPRDFDFDKILQQRYPSYTPAWEILPP